MKPACIGLVLLAALARPVEAAHVAPDEFSEVQQLMLESARWNMPRLEQEVQRREALVLGSDRTPVDVVWRRITALLKDLRALPQAPDLSAEAEALARLQPAVETLRNSPAPPVAQQRELFLELTGLRRRIAFKNPMLDFDAILFLKHNKQVRGYRHMVDQYLGFNAEKAGGVFVLVQPFSRQPAVRSLLANSRVENGRLEGRLLDNAGGFLALDLNFDGRTILFAFTEAEHRVPAGASYDNQYCPQQELGRDPGALHHYFRPESTYHIFRANADGTHLRQLTDGMWNDYDPCFLPNGRVAFISERAGGQVRCGMRPLPTATLHSMQADGSDLIQLSWHDTQEWQPSVDHQGRLVYTRWDYVDRDSDVAHHLWSCYPDGRDPRSPHGNYPDRRELRPWMEMSIRAVPGSHRYVAVATPHHGQAYGSIVLIDPHRTDDNSTAQVRRITPEVPFPESESQPGVPHPKGQHAPAAEVYGTPWPLSEDYFLCVRDAGQSNYGIYLIDAFGNRELLYRDPRLACLDPIPLRRRPSPPVLPNATLQTRADRGAEGDPACGTVAILNVYDSRKPLPPGTRVKQVRVINLFPKDNPFMDDPNVGVAAQSLCRGVLGVAPVETDGSAHFTVPAGAPIYFQLLDEQGLAVQTMRSDTYLHPGETLSCAGCHQSPQQGPAVSARQSPLALRRPPSPLAPEVANAYPLSFPRLVQPLLDQKCVGCHDREPKAPSLHGDRFGKFGWSDAFHSLKKHAWGMSGGNGVALTERQYSIPGRDGARVTRLYQMLTSGHHDLKLAPDELRRITLWLDCNSNFYGAYTDLEPQARGALVRPRWGLPAGVSFDRLAQASAATQ
jgi:hypothetical protein